MNIMISANSNYLKPAIAMLYSLFQSNPGTRMDIYMPYSDLTAEEVAGLVQYVSLFQDKRLIPMEMGRGFSQKVTAHNGISIETYYRILAIDQLPMNIERILYLDVDMIIRGSLEEVYQTDLEGVPFAVCEDILGILNGFHEMNKYRMGIPKEYSYFNAGMMLFNLQYLRETDAADKIMDRIYQNYQRYEYNDQDVLNEMYYDRLRWIAWDQYNLPPALYYLDKQALKNKQIAFANYDTIRENLTADPKGFADRYQDLSYSMRDNAKIIHYMGAAKPWKRGEEDAQVYYYYDKLYWENLVRAENRWGTNGRLFAKQKQEIVGQLLAVGYTYYYLKNRIDKALRLQKTGRKAWVLGSSYAAQGILDHDKSWLCNLSAPSQDLYYDSEVLDKLLLNSKDSEVVCVLVLGYYALYDDLSMAKSQADIMQITYGPLIGNTHHAFNDHYDIHKEAKRVYSYLTEEQILECEDTVHEFFESNSYFNALYTRENNDPDILGEWTGLTSEQKDQIGRDRAEKHNRLLKNEDIKEENQSILEGIFEKLNRAGIPMIIIIPPFTKEYLQQLSKQFRGELWDFIEESPYAVEFIDFNDTDYFDPSDFFDSDHLNGKGALKMTDFISQITQEVSF